MRLRPLTESCMTSSVFRLRDSSMTSIALWPAGRATRRRRPPPTPTHHHTHARAHAHAHAHGGRRTPTPAHPHSVINARALGVRRRCILKTCATPPRVSTVLVRRVCSSSCEQVRTGYLGAVIGDLGQQYRGAFFTTPGPWAGVSDCFEFCVTHYVAPPVLCIFI